MLTLDTSGVVALVSRADPHHEQAANTLESESRPFFIPAAILSEIAYILEERAGAQAVLVFVQNLEDNALTLHCGEQDIPRVRELIERYEDLKLGLADASVIACTERRGGRVLTFDRRHFPVVARGEGTIIVLPQL